MPLLFETERLMVRDWDLDRDVEGAFAMYSDPEVMRFLGRNPVVVPDLDVMRERLAKVIAIYSERNDGTGGWAMESKADGQIVGALLVKRLPDAEGTPTPDMEVGWHLRRSAWGKGYASEAGAGGVRYAFETLKVPVIYAVVKPENHRSIAVTQRIGMKPLGQTDRYYGETLELFERGPKDL
jgi:[ribosomal protein S5]-alanine N-acetyltransferase